MLSLSLDYLCHQESKRFVTSSYYIGKQLYLLKNQKTFEVLQAFIQGDGEWNLDHQFYILKSRKDLRSVLHV